MINGPPLTNTKRRLQTAVNTIVRGQHVVWVGQYSTMSA